MFRILLTALTILAILVVRFVLKLPLHPYRAARGLLRRLSAPA